MGTGVRDVGDFAADGNEPPNFSLVTGKAMAPSEPPNSSSVTGKSMAPSDPRVALLNLSFLGQKMDSLRRSLSHSMNRDVPICDEQLQEISSEISSAIHQVIINSTILLASAPPPDVAKTPQIVYQASLNPSEASHPYPPSEAADADTEIVEIDSAELMAEHVHFCEICGKGFRRDANLRMHMRAHGERFKTLDSLSKLDNGTATGGISLRRPVLFSCPSLSCRRNQNHTLFRPLKSAVCVRNHYRRSHCPKMYTCDLCNMKSFSVVADLKTHRKSCGEMQWWCSCGMRFSRKDALFSHVTMFDGHMPVVGTAEEEKENGVVRGGEVKDEKGEEGVLDEGFFDGIMEEIGGMRGGWMGL